MAQLIHAGAIPFRSSTDGWEYLLVTSKSGNWIFPKGIVEYTRTPEETAQRECAEEAGVQGTLLPDEVGSYEDRKWQQPCKVHMYLLRFESEVDWEEIGLRRREWCLYEEAAGRLSKPELKHLLEIARTRLQRLGLETS